MMRGYGFGYGMMGRGYGIGGSWLLHLLGVMFWLALAAAIVVVIIAAISSSKHGHGHAVAATPMGAVGPLEVPPVETPAPAPPADPAVEVARTRFATGEISKKEFEEIVKTLQS